MKPGKLIQDLTIEYEDTGGPLFRPIHLSKEDAEILHKDLKEPLEMIYENYLLIKWNAIGEL